MADGGPADSEAVTSTGTVGRRAEDLACRYLTARGLQLIARNYRARSGELDLIMQDRGCLVFVEVRYRASARFGGAAASIDARKRQRIWKTAEHYLQRHAAARKQSARFDVISIDGKGRQARIEWIKDAFRA